MRLWTQIILGSLVLAFCALIHIATLVIGSQVFKHFSITMRGDESTVFWGMLILLSFGVVLAAHTLQIWIWALALKWIGALHRTDDALYFALVTTTTLGYGDVTLERDHRVFGAMSAVSGLLTFGLSTAFLIAIVERMMAVLA